MVGIYRDMKRRGIYLAICTDAESDSCFTVKYLPDQWDKKWTNHFLELANLPVHVRSEPAEHSFPQSHPLALAVNIFISALDHLLRENRGSVDRLFLNERRHLIWANNVWIDSVLGTCPVHCKLNRIKNFYLSVNLNNPNSFAFLVFVGTAASFDARM